MRWLQHPQLLRYAIRFDGVSAGTLMLGLLGLNQPLAQVFGLPSSFLWYVGLGLIPWVTWLVWLSFRPTISRAAAWFVVVVNGLWLAESIWLIVGPTFEPTVWGYGFLIAQAILVALITETEIIALRRKLVNA
ncbi:hypothetical protein [Herpetosiphon llansteffanensis]|uniref:hypothetical protein n=1 Tax=Herpetosiphon llansteffanensis TaxID=2094568 RepID=UPI000D7C0382|nr:hypothetical protein [Herpetosiphon llansteffanensis]